MTSPQSPKPATIEDVARVAGTALSTASLALNGRARVAPATRQAVLRAAEELGFKANPLAQRLANGSRSKHIDLFSLMLDGGVGIAKIKAIHSLLTRRGYDVPFHSYDFYYGDHDQETVSLMQALCRQQPCAIVCATPGVGAGVLAELERFQNQGGAVVCYDDRVAIACDNVVFDFAHSISCAVRHLLELGHRDIGLYVQGHDAPPRAALDGWKRALSQYKVAPRDEWLFGTSTAGEEGGLRLAARFLQLKRRPTAMCIVNDHAALAFMVKVGRAGVRVPEDLSIVGHDDLPVARCCPAPLTTVSHPLTDIAERVVELLTDRLEERHGSAPRRVVVRGELVRRESAAPPR